MYILGYNIQLNLMVNRQFILLVILPLLFCSEQEKVHEISENSEAILQPQLIDYQKQDSLRKIAFLNDLEIDYLDGKSIDFYLDHPATKEIVKEFYRGDFFPSDNDKTFELLKVLFEEQKEIHPFYFHCMNSIIRYSDGALSEALGGPAQKMIYNYPDYAFSYFEDHDEIFDEYIGLIGYEMYFQKNGTSSIKMPQKDFFSYLEHNLDLQDLQTKALFTRFVDGINAVQNELD